jgi:hypothetical protein
MSTARNRFGVSILVALVLGVLLTAAPAGASTRGATDSGQPAMSDGASDFQVFGAIGEIATATAGRTHAAIALGAGVPLLIVGSMVRRRIYADV